MSLTTTDLEDIRTIFREEIKPLEVEVARLATEVTELGNRITSLEIRVGLLENRVTSLEGKVVALEDDVKEIYFMLEDFQKATGIDRSFKKLSLENKILKLHTEIQATAKQANIVLPRS